MKIETAKLEGAALDWAVAKALYTDRRVEISPFGHIQVEKNPGCGEILGFGWFAFSPSTAWAQGGPIIERERIAIRYETDWEVPNWGAWRVDVDDRQEIMGETPLIAAMRCYVASKLGAVVEVPDELVR